MDLYKQFFRVYPVSQLDLSEEKKNAANFGGKIYLPASALARLTLMRISYPMLFELRASNSSNATYAGVLEFIAPEGRVYVPQWIMDTLRLKPAALLEIRSTSLPLGSFVKIEPQSPDFLEISNVRAVLESSLRNFSALHTNDIFQISYNDHTYGIKVLECRPETEKQAISVVETNLEVDFAPPVGYIDPASKRARTKEPEDDFGQTKPTNSETAAQYVQQALSVAKQQSGIRLSGKEVKVNVSPVDTSIYSNRDAPELDLPQGQLFFGFPVVPINQESESKPNLFTGGQALREKKADN